MLRSASCLPILLGLCACAGNAKSPAAKSATALHKGDGEQSAAAHQPSGKDKAKAKDADPLFPEKEQGWTIIDTATKAKIDAFAGDYFDFVQTTQTQRQSTRALLAIARGAGAKPFDDKSQHKAGELLYWVDESESSLALLKIGAAPIQEGMRVIISASDAAHLRLTPNPLYEKSGLALFDTSVLGSLTLESWLHTPLALHVYLSPKARGEKAQEVIIGDDEDEPVFSIPDLLPHLSRKVQRDQLVDSPERLDAIAAFSGKALFAGLARYGISARDLNRAEAILVPAGAPSFVGVDRALIAASNHDARAMPYAALRGILASDSTHNQLVIIMGHNRSFYAGAGPEQHLANLLPAALKHYEAKLDALAMRRIMARSSVLLFDHAQGERNQGVALNTRRDDSSPSSFRDALTLLEGAGVQVQILEAPGWSQARELASLDVDTVEAGLPIAGKNSPYELVSILDLYSSLLASTAWLQGARP